MAAGVEVECQGEVGAKDYIVWLALNGLYEHQLVL
jgi:hypothetical protein